MFTDAHVSADLATLVDRIAVPTVPLAKIRQRVRGDAHVTHGPSTGNLAVAAIIACALGVAAPAVASGLARSIEARVIAVLGWHPPPPAPASLISAMHLESGTFAAAQSRVRFAITPPSGLPRDASTATISTSPVGVYVKGTHSWHIGAIEVTFAYRRSGARSFSLLADAYDPQSDLPPKYIFEDGGVSAHGIPILIRHQNFVWRNGNQVMSAVAGNGISVREIASIVLAMHGLPLPTAMTPKMLNARGTEVMHRIPPP